jgi:hypothetical protein
MGELIWSCKIGAASQIPPNSDAPMRAAVVHAYYELTGEYPNFIFSGWGDKLTDVEEEALERHVEIREMAMAEPKLESEQRMDRIELAISMIAEKLELPEVNRVLQGGPLEGVSDERVLGGDSYPAAERQEEPGPEVSGVRDVEN